MTYIICKAEKWEDDFRIIFPDEFVKKHNIKEGKKIKICSPQ